MKKFLFFTYLLLLIPRGYGDPVITFTSPLIDFGEIREGEVPELLFEFSNTGDSLLVIHKTDSSCGCTVPELSLDAYAPGEKGKLSVRFDSTGFSGKVSKVITVYSNSKKRYVRLTIKGVVLERESGVLSWSPGILSLGKVELGKSITGTVLLENSSPVDFIIETLTTPPEIRLMLKQKVIKGKEKVSLSIHFKAMERGRFEGYVTLKARGEFGEAETLKVEGIVR